MECFKYTESGYLVSGEEFYSLSGDYVPKLLGTVEGTGTVSMAHNGIQIFIAAGAKGYIYNINTKKIAEIDDPDFPGAETVDFIDSYFVFNEPDSQKFWVTSLLDGASIDPLEYSSAEGSPDLVVAVKVTHREAWIFGEDSVEVFYNSGAVDFPLSRIQGAFIETGCAAPNSIAKLDNALFWLGSDERGHGIVYRTSGYAGVRVSDHSLETIIQGFDALEDAVAYSYQQNGHSFYVLTFPTESRTFVLDVATSLWHERAGFAAGQFTRHRSVSHMSFNKRPHVGDFENGNIYVLDLDTYTDDGEVQKWLRTWPATTTGQNTLRYNIHHQLELNCEAGVGVSNGLGEDSVVVLRWSDDYGKTWSNTHLKGLGKLGEYSHRTVWRRLGRTRGRVYELSGTDPNKIILLGAELRSTETRS